MSSRNSRYYVKKIRKSTGDPDLFQFGVTLKKPKISTEGSNDITETCSNPDEGQAGCSATAEGSARQVGNDMQCTIPPGYMFSAVKIPVEHEDTQSSADPAVEDPAVQIGDSRDSPLVTQESEGCQQENENQCQMDLCITVQSNDAGTTPTVALESEACAAENLIQGQINPCFHNTVPVDIEVPETSLPENVSKCRKSLCPSSEQSQKGSLSYRKKNSAELERNFTWLYYSNAKGGYMCKFCSIFPTGSEVPFVTAGANLGDHPIRKLQRHQDTAKHERSEKTVCGDDQQRQIDEVLNNKHTKPSEKEAEQIDNRQYLKIVIQALIFLIQKKWGYTKNLEDLVHLMGSTGNPCVSNHLSSKLPDYLSTTTNAEIAAAIAQCVDDEQLGDLRGKRWTLFLDESTDNANRSQASVMGRWVGEEGEVREHFLGLMKMNGCKAADFEEAVVRFCEDKALPINLIRFLAFDGCSTMSGSKSGLQRRLKNHSPLAQYINCRNHKLALCIVHIVKKTDTLQEVESLLVSLWKVFHYSPKKYLVFVATQELYDEKPVTLVKDAGTRWLSHLQACSRFVSRFECILDTLDSIVADTKEPEVEGIRNKATNRRLVMTILLLTDVLKPVNNLTLYLQNDKGFFTSLKNRVDVTINDLQDIIRQLEEGNFEGLEFRKVDDLLSIIQDRASLSRRMRDSCEEDPKAFLNDFGIQLIQQLVQEAFNEESAVLEALSVLDPAYLPPRTELVGYGKAKGSHQHPYGVPVLEVSRGQ